MRYRPLKSTFSVLFKDNTTKTYDLQTMREAGCSVVGDVVTGKFYFKYLNCF